MARWSQKVSAFSALLLLLSTTSLVLAQEDDSEDEVTVETVEDQELYRSPQVNPARVYLAEHFDDEPAFKKRWVKSEAKKQGVDETIAKYDGKWEIKQPSRKILKDDLGLVLTTEAKHAAISTLLDRPFEFKDKPLVVQYEVTMQEGQNCGGAYLKLLSKGTNSKADLKQFHDQTAYTIMFGPDKCGNDNKLHFIFRHKNPKNGSIEEKHSKKPSQRLDDIYKDKEPHLYTLVVRPDNSYTVFVDHKEMIAGSLLEDFTPPVNPPEEIDDPTDKKPEDWDDREKDFPRPVNPPEEIDEPTDKKPEDWDDREKIVDPSASKPEDWDEDAPAQIVDPNAVKPDGWLDDEPEMISDPDAQRPSDWDDDMDGEWEAPLIDNPACAAAPGCGLWKPPVIPNPDYKGIWRAPLIPNPNYKGKWTPRRIPNPDYFRDDHPFRMTPIHAVGFELWSMSPLLLFDNLIITDDVNVATQWAHQSFDLKRAKLSKDSDSVVDRAVKYAADNPWVYAVLIIVSFLVVGFTAFLCVGSKSSTDEEDTKKTDAVLEDDPHQSDEEERDEDAPQERANKADLEGPEADNNEETPLVEPDGAGDAQRKRKPRKE